MVAFEWWVVTAAANVIVFAVYSFLAYTMWDAIARGRQFTTNPLLVASGFIFATCAIGHAIHLEHVVWPALAGSPEFSAAVRTTFGDPRLIAWDTFTAAVAIWYFALRSRLALLWRGAAICEDLQERERQALAIHDRVVQGLATAKMSLDMGLHRESTDEMRRTLESAKSIISQLLGEKGSEIALGPGDLRRKVASR